MTSENIILNPLKNQLKTSILVVDSRHRDKKKFPNPNEYIYTLNEKYNRVISAELLSAYIPQTSNIINTSNNELCINIDDIDYNIYFPIGDYRQNNTSNNYINLDENINNILSSFSSDVSSIRCLYDYNKKKYFFYNIYLNQIKSFNLDFNGTEIEKYEINNVMTKNNIIKQNKYLIKTESVYKKNSIGSILGFKPKIYTNNIIKCYFETLPGYIKISCKSVNDFNLLYFTITNKNPILSRILISNSIDFNTNTYLINFNPEKIIQELGINQPNLLNIYQQNNSNYTNLHKIHELNQNNLYIVLSNQMNWFNNLNNNWGYIRFSFIEADFKPNFNKDPYVLLQIRDFDRLDSTDTDIQNSYELIPFTDTINIFEHSRSYGNIKIFETGANVLDRLNISFKNINGDLYDFMGQEHFMTFAITYNNKYN